MEVTEVKNGIPVLSPAPITREALQREYDFISAGKFVTMLFTDGVITQEERHRVMQKLRDRISPLYKEIRA